MHDSGFYLTCHREKRNSSPLWHRALERYREELEETDDYQDMLEGGSLENLLDYTRDIESLLPKEKVALTRCIDAKLTGLVWGSIRIILTLASSAGDILQDVLDMLEELSLTLPRFKNYENTLPMDRALESALLIFFEPDAIHELVLVEGSKLLNDEEFEFLHDEMDLGDAEQVLLQAALIDKSMEDAILSLHRLVQAVIMRRLTEEDRTKHFDTVVRILSWGFPDTWSEDVGHQFQAWTKCEKCLPHVNHLVKQGQQCKIRSQNVQLYGELLLRCSWYLYEREWYDVARNLVDVALETFEDKTTLAYASAVDLSGLIDLDMNNPEKALIPFNTALAIREARLGSDDAFIAFSLNNIALAYTETGELDKAYATHQKAIDIRSRTKSDRLGNSWCNLSSLLLRMGKPDEAEEMLRRYPGLGDLADAAFLESGNPRVCGNMVLLSRIRLRQGRLDDAMRLASKALTFRQQQLGNRLKTCDSLYDVAGLLCRQGKEASAIDLLTQLVAISETLNEGEGQLARSKYKLAVLYDHRGMRSESESCKARAMELRAKLRPELKDAPFEESEFMKLCLWMLW